MRALALALALLCAAPAHADDADAFEQLHEQIARGRRRVSWSLLAGGLVSTVAGAGLMIPGGDNQGWRWAGGTALAFGAIDVLLAALALPALKREERSFAAASAERRTPAGLDAQQRRLLKELDRESVVYAVNLGLDAMYSLGGVVAVIASQQGVTDHERWLGVGVVSIVEGVFLIGIDAAGVVNARRGHDKLVDLLHGRF
jgi:MFS family permease